MNYNNINNINPPIDYNYATRIPPINSNNINNNFIFDTSRNRDPLLNPYVIKEINKLKNQQGLSKIITILIKTYYSISSTCCCKTLRTQKSY